MTWTARDRFLSTCSGEIADRSPLGAWRHFRAEEYSAADLARVTADYAAELDMDWIKLNPRAVYYAEVWGNAYDTARYDTVRDVPLQTRLRVTAAEDVGGIERVRVADSPVLSEQVEALRETVARSEGRPVLQTLFSPLSTLFQMSGVSYYPGVKVHGVAGEVDLVGLMRDRPALVHGALRAITDSYLEYAHELLAAGSTGLFYAVTGTAYASLMPAEAFDEFSARYDREILDSIQGRGPRVLHTCGPFSQAERFVDYPVEAINWDHYGEGNPAFDELAAPVIAGGLDHRRFRAEHVDELRAQLDAATALGRTRPLLIAPTCSIKSYDMSAEAGAMLGARG